MGKKNNAIEQTGVIVENCGNTNFRIQLDVNPDVIVKGTISGKMRILFFFQDFGFHFHFVAECI